MHKSYYIYITIKFHQIFTFFRPFLLHSYNTYYVRVGGNADGYIDTTFTVGSTDPENPYANSTRLLGDVDGNNVLTGLDASTTLSASAGLTTLTGENLQAADCDDNAVVTGLDASQILAGSAGLSTTVDFTKTIATKQNYVAE